MRDLAPRHIRKVYKTVNASEVYKGAVVGYVLNEPFHNGAFLEFFDCNLFKLFAVFFENGPPGYDYIIFTAVVFKHFEFEGLAYELIGIPYRLQVYL